MLIEKKIIPLGKCCHPIIRGVRMRKYTVTKILSDLFLGLGLIFIMSPIILYWFIHGDYERYIWIIKGPYPFSHFGGGPFQLFMYIGLFFAGVSLIAVSMIIKRAAKE